MGYRNYIGVMPKREYNKIKSLTIDEIYKFYNVDDDLDEDFDNRHVGVYEFGKELYGFGKYVDFQPPKGSVKTFFKNKEAEKRWNEENDLKIVTKDFLKYIIESYIGKVNKYYDDMLKPFYETRHKQTGEFIKSRKRDYDEDYNVVSKGDITLITDEENVAINKMIDHIKSMSDEWKPFGGYLHINLEDETDKVITHSWKYEYSIFELVNIYKSFDWKKNVMIYYGY